MLVRRLGVEGKGGDSGRCKEGVQIQRELTAWGLLRQTTMGQTHAMRVVRKVNRFL